MRHLQFASRSSESTQVHVVALNSPGVTHMKFFRGRPSTGRHRSRGQAVVEFALIVPIFIMLLAGMIDFGIGLSATW